MSRPDDEALFLRARSPSHITATGDVYAEGRRGMVTTLLLNAAAEDATAVLREGGSGGTIIWSISALTATSQPVSFPAGLIFQDGFHVTLGGAGATLDVAGTSELNPS